MAENGYGHAGRIPSYGKTQVNPMGNVEPPACIQNAMMTKDKKPFTYTPGGLDLSQIRTPSMARRLARQRSQEEHELAYNHQPSHQHPGYHPAGGQGTTQGGSVPPPPPPPMAPAPPPPPPLVIKNSNSPKPVVLGERPEIVIPENPIGMLRKTNSPYHWEAEKADQARLGPVPKFVEKMPSPLTVKVPPATFSQQPPQQYTPQNQNNQRQNYQQPESPIHKPEAQYAQKFSPASASPPIRENLQRQDSQFNKNPVPFSGQSPTSNGSAFSPSPNSSWRQPERRDSPANNVKISPQINRGPISPNNQSTYQNNSPPVNNSPAFNTLRTTPKPQANNTIYNNVSQARPQSPRVDTAETAPWRTNTINHNSPKSQEPQPNIYHNSPPVNQQPAYTPPWKTQEVNNNQPSNPWKQESKPNQVNNQQQQQQSTWANQDKRSRDPCSPPWRAESRPAPPQTQKPTPQPPLEQRFQSTMTIPVTQRQPKQEPPRNQSPQRECVYVNQEPVYFCPESPKSIPPWVKTQKEKTKTPPPQWCQRPLEGRKSAPRELVTPPRDTEPEWVKKSNEMQRNIREVVSPPRNYQQPQPTWSTKPSDNRKSVPKDSPPDARFVPIQTEGQPQGHPQLRITIGLQPNQNQQNPQGPFSQPTQRIMRVLSPQLVRTDEGPSQHDLPSLTRSFDSQEGQHKTRIIPIQIEGGNGGNKRVHYHKFAQEAPPRQSKAFRVLQVITGTQDDVDSFENQQGYSDL